MKSFAAVELRDVAFSYSGQEVLGGVNLSLAPGTSTALTGANGSGKSTLLGLMAGILKPSRGDVRRRGTARPAFVLQRSAVPESMPLTAGQAVAMGCWGSRGWLRPLGTQGRAAVAEALERVGLAELAHRQLGELSGGQRQRVLLAQGIAQGSNLLLLDEPTAGVDGESQDRIRRIIEAELDRGVTVVEATHSAADAAGAGRLVVLEGGRIVADSLAEGVGVRPPGKETSPVW